MLHRLIRRSTFRNTGERVANHELILTKIIEALDSMEESIAELRSQIDIIIGGTKGDNKGKRESQVDERREVPK